MLHIHFLHLKIFSNRKRKKKKEQEGESEELSYVEQIRQQINMTDRKVLQKLKENYSFHGGGGDVGAGVGESPTLLDQTLPKKA